MIKAVAEPIVHKYVSKYTCPECLEPITIYTNDEHGSSVTSCGNCNRIFSIEWNIMEIKYHAK